MFTVSADHVAPKWQVENIIFEIDKRVDGQGRIGHRAAAHGFPEEFWAELRNFGCGRSCSTPEAAIRDLLQSNGCTRIRITKS